MIDIDKIKKNKKSSIFGKYIYYIPEIDSTNSYAQRLAQEGAPEGTVVLTDYQKDGRGRLDRTWESSRGANVLMSLILRPKVEIERAIRITLASVEIVVGSLEKLLKKSHSKKIEFSVKWPNDIMVNGKKIAGILAESSLREKKILYVVVGIGININQNLSELSKDVRKSSTSLLAETGKEFKREKIILEIITSFEKNYFYLERTKYDHVIEAWKRHCPYIGKNIIIETHTHHEEGKFIDVNEKGVLLYKTEDGQLKELVTGTIKSIKARNGSDG
jgi:BirA family biotin operon repressor/biotin-[acetyl-CoA-carboxylase] ligase